MSGFDIGGAAHSSITSLVGLIQLVKRTYDSHQEVKQNLEDLERLCNSTDAKISRLTGIIEASTDTCPFFDSIKQNIEEINTKYAKVRDVIEARFVVSNFIRSSDTARQLGAILADLKTHDNTLNIVGSIAQLLMIPVRQSTFVAVSNLQYNSNDTRVLECIQAEIERSDEEGTEIGTREPLQEVDCNVSLGRRYYGEGLTFYEGRLDEDYTRALQLFKAALEKGTWQAAFYLGEMYYRGQGVEQNFENSFNYYLVGAGEGDPDSLTLVGESLCLGRGIPRDYEKAVQYYKKGSDAGSRRGKYYYGCCLFNGRTISPDPVRGFKLLKEASQAGEFGANSTLAECYKTGVQVEIQSASMAFDLMKSAFDNDVLWSARKLARYYEEGIGVEKDYSTAAHMYKELYDKGGIEGADALPYYARCLILGQGLPKNARKGWRLLNESCVKTSESACWDILGDCYRYGHGTEKNPEKAIESYKQSILINDRAESVILSHYSLAVMHEIGEGVAQSYENSLYYFMYAADRYFNKAQWKIGNMFELGLGVESHADRAAMYFHLCARGGNEEAHLKVQSYLVKGQGVEHPRVSTAKSIEEAATQGHYGAKKWIRKWGSRLRHITTA